MADKLDEGLELFNFWKANTDIGEYTLTVQQKVTHHKEGADWVFEPPNAQKFTVGDLRFSLSAADVTACFPAPDSVTPAGRLLPHVALRDPYLPWERGSHTPEGWGEAPGTALLVFAEGELNTDDVKPGQAFDLLAKTSQDPLPPNFETSEIPKVTCTTLDISPSDLLRLLPDPVKSLPFLTHVRREVRTAADGLAAAPAVSAVIASRFPRQPGRYIAHLVSLLGHEKNLMSPEKINGKKKVRLVSLWSWQFTISPPAETYAEAFKRMQEDSKKPMKNRLRFMPQPEVKISEAVTQRLAAGYLPMPYRVASGEKTAGWYRGPLGPWPPVKSAFVAQHTPFTCADEALIYTDKDGTFDLSLAAAWSIGYQLILSRHDLFGQLLTLQNTVSRHTLTMVAAARTAEGQALLTGITDAAPGSSAHLALLADLADPPPMRLKFDQLMANTTRSGGSLSGAITSALSGPPRPVMFSALAPAPAVETHHSLPAAPEAVALLDRPEATSALKSLLRQRLLRPSPQSQEPAGAAAVGGGGPVEEWLWDPVDLLGLLPAWYLVPMAEAALPSDSLRFFSIDHQWLSAFCDGMLAVGTHTALDEALTPLLAEVIFKPRTATQDPACGILMRSEVIRAWPHHPIAGKGSSSHPIVIDKDPGYFSVQGGATLLARTQVSPDTVLLLFDKAPTTVTLQEPGHVMQFGLDTDTGKTKRNKDGIVQGSPVAVFDDYLYNTPGHPKDVLDVSRFAPKICDNAAPTPASFAYQMLNPPAQLKISIV
ncbi:hypothetical protein [Streptomyces sp. NPDC002537]